jgi:anti-anti-sigma factor
MEVTVTRPASELAIVAIRGQLDIDTAPDLRAAFAGLQAEPVSQIVADLSQLSFCDSIGLSTLVLAHRFCIDKGGWLRLADPTPFLTRLLAVVGIADVVPIYRSTDGALAGDPDDLLEIPGEVNA